MRFLNLKLSERQDALLRELSRRNGALADMYLGALTVLHNIDNPDRIHQAAHSIRELMQKLPEITKVGMPEKGATLKDKVTELQDGWRAMLKRTKASGAGGASGWTGIIDVPLKKFILKTESFFGWYGANYIHRNEQVRRFLRGLDGAGRVLPDFLENETIQIWKDMRDYFVGVAHHSRPGDIDDFISRLSSFEEFILKKLHPETIADFNEIETLIQEGEEK